MSFHRPERGVFWQEMGTRDRSFLSSLPQSAFGAGEGRDIDGGKTIGHWHVINAIYARTISWTGA